MEPGTGFAMKVESLDATMRVTTYAIVPYQPTLQEQIERWALEIMRASSAAEISGHATQVVHGETLQECWRELVRAKNEAHRARRKVRELRVLQAARGLIQHIADEARGTTMHEQGARARRVLEAQEEHRRSTWPGLWRRG